MTDARKDFCDRCGFNVTIYHHGEVPRKPPHRGTREILYCKPCYDVIAAGQYDPYGGLLKPAESPGAAVTNFDKHSRPKPAHPDPAQEIVALKWRTKMQWYATGFVTGLVIGLSLAVMFLGGIIW